MRPKNRDKGGCGVVSARAAPRLTGAYGPREGVRPRPGAGQRQHSFFFVTTWGHSTIRF